MEGRSRRVSRVQECQYQYGPPSKKVFSKHAFCCCRDGSLVKKTGQSYEGPGFNFQRLRGGPQHLPPAPNTLSSSGQCRPCVYRVHRQTGMHTGKTPTHKIRPLFRSRREHLPASVSWNQPALPPPSLCPAVTAQRMTTLAVYGVWLHSG